MIEPPDYAALINPIVGNAFALRYVGRKDFVQELSLDTGSPNQISKININLFEGQMAELAVCDSLMFISPFVKLVTAVPADYAAQLLIARLTVTLEGETVVDKALLEKFLVAPPFVNAEASDSGRRLVYVGRNEDSLIGGCRLFFTTPKPTLKMLLENVPGGTGLIRLIYGVVLGHYTTKAKTGALFEVGTLDAQQQCFPISTRWAEPQKGDITEDKLERAYGDVLKGMLQEREAEIRRLTEEKAAQIRRMNEDAELREKAEKKRVELEEERRKQIEEINLRMAEEKEKKFDELYARNAELLKESKIGVRPDEMPVVLRPEGKLVADARADHLHAPVNFEAALARAKKRLVRWGIIATLALLAAAIAIRFLILKT